MLIDEVVQVSKVHVEAETVEREVRHQVLVPKHVEVLQSTSA